MSPSPLFRITAACFLGVLVSLPAQGAQSNEDPAAAPKKEAAKPAAPAKTPDTRPAETPAPPTAESAEPAKPASAPVFCGSFTPFRFRVTAGGKDPDARASFATDVINKYLGGAVGKFTTKEDPKTKNVRLLLNNELVAIVTPADAAAEKLKTPQLLAAKWAKLLSIAFEASKAQR